MPVLVALHPSPCCCRWALYDYGLQAIKQWAADHQHPYPEVLKRLRDKDARKEEKRQRAIK